MVTIVTPKYFNRLKVFNLLMTNLLKKQSAKIFSILKIRVPRKQYIDFFYIIKYKFVIKCN